MIPLLEQYPKLQTRLPYFQLCDLPTSVQPLVKFGELVHHDGLFIKRDDLSGELFGGNKVRALEFLLASAGKQGGNIVIGLPGTSMALATNIFAHKLGIPIKTLLIEQSPTKESKENLRYFQFLGADLIAASFPNQSKAQTEQHNISSFISDQLQPNIINPSSPLGMCGYVNAAFELQQQIAAGDLPEPDYLYVPLGLLGTATGLMVGLTAAGLKTKVVGVPVPPVDENRHQEIKNKIVELFEQVCNYLHQFDPLFPMLTLKETEFELRGASPYAAEAGLSERLEWIPRFDQLEDIKLDATWTSPTIVAILNDIEKNELKGKVVLYWHTFNSRPYPDNLAQLDYHQLPRPFWHYFEADELTIINKPATM